MGMLYLHNDIFLTDITGYDQLKFSQVHTPKIKSWVRHCFQLPMSRFAAECGWGLCHKWMKRFKVFLFKNCTLTVYTAHVQKIDGQWKPHGW